MLEVLDPVIRSLMSVKKRLGANTGIYVNRMITCSSDSDISNGAVVCVDYNG
jgi:hypothetical protein